MCIEFGMPVLLETKSIEISAALCRELGLDFLELNMNFPECQTDRLDVIRLAEIAKLNNIYYTIHLDENLNPCDFNEKVAKAYTETVLQTIKTAKALNIPLLNMHLAEGVYITLPHKRAFLFDEYNDIYMHKLKAFRDTCSEAIENTEIKICVENTNGYNRADFLGQSLDLLLESPVFKLTFDIGHNAGIGFSDEQIILERSDKLFHMHIHDAENRGCHLTLGDGDLDLLKYINMAGEYNCRAVLETKTVDSLRRSVGWLRERGYIE